VSQPEAGGSRSSGSPPPAGPPSGAGATGLARLRSRPVVGAIAVILTLAAGVSFLALRRPASPTGSPGPGPSAPTAAQWQLGITTGDDIPYDPATIRSPTEGANQAKVWRADGTWWATMVGSGSQELRIARLDPATGRFVDTGTVVDERGRVAASVAWDGDRLAVLTAGDRPTESSAARITTFHLDPRTHTFVIDPDVPIALTDAGVTAPTIVRDGAGVLWFAAVQDEMLLVRHSVGDDRHWSADVSGALGADATPARTASLLWNGGRTTLAWSRTGDSDLHVATHADADPDTRWTADSVTVEGLHDAGGDLALAGATTPSGSRLFVAFEAGTVPNAGALAPGAVVATRAPDGTWATAQLGRTKDHLRTPTLAVDETNGLLLAIAGTSDGGVVVKPSRLDRPSFDVGVGIAVVGASGDPASAPSIAAGPADLTDGLLVLTSDDTAGRYRHAMIVLKGTGSGSPEPSPSSAPSGSGAPSPSGSPTSSGSPSAPPASGSPSPSGAPAGPIVLRVDTFDAWAEGTAPPTWSATGQSGGTGSLSVVAIRSDVDRSLRTTTTSRVGSVRACTTAPPTTTGSLTVSSLVRVDRLGTSDTTIASVRGPGGEAASLRITRHGLLAWYVGPVKRTSTVAVATGTWVRTRLSLDLIHHTWSWTVTTTEGKALARVSNAAWRQPDIPALDTVCVQPGEGAGSALTIDDVTVAR
jgi:hypothetical protein